MVQTVGSESIPATPLQAAREFWDVADRFKADTERVSVFAGSTAPENHARLWRDDVQDPIAMDFVKPLGLAPGAKVLEFGCGTGRMTVLDLLENDGHAALYSLIARKGL